MFSRIAAQWLLVAWSVHGLRRPDVAVNLHQECALDTSKIQERLAAYAPLNSSRTKAVVTYAGFNKLSYIDGAIMLGRALSELHLKGIELVSLVQGPMADEHKQLLKDAGWKVVDIQPWLPEHWKQTACGYWRDSYNIVDVWRQPYDRVLYLDADTFFWGSRRDIEELLGGPLGPEQVKMVRDCSGSEFNGGMMVFHPSAASFEVIFNIMAAGTLNQPAVNRVYKDNVIELPSRYNVHGRINRRGGNQLNCSDVVAAHYTGLHKPTEANVTNMEMVMTGEAGNIFFKDRSALQCRELYQRLFLRMREERQYLTPQLRSILERPEFANVTKEQVMSAKKAIRKANAVTGARKVAKRHPQ